MNGNTLEAREKTHWTDRVPDASVVEFTETRSGKQTDTNRKRRGIFSLVSELRRRKVCRAATAYCIALWLTCQIVEVVSSPLGLPEWTLEFVIVLGLVGLPIALILAWLFEVTPNGLMLDNQDDSRSAVTGTDMPRSRFDQVIDCSLLLVAVVISAELALSSFASNLEASPIPTEEFYISAFSVVSDSNGDAFSSALQVELQHEMARLPKAKVVAPTNPSKLTTGSSLTGAVAMDDNAIQVTALVVSNDSGELAWSEVLHFSIKESGGAPRSIAKGIVSALEDWSNSNSVPGG